MTRPYVQPQTRQYGEGQTRIQRLSVRLWELFSHDQGRPLNLRDTDATKVFLERLAKGTDSTASAYLFTERQPPRDMRFDVWGKCWLPATDTFQWERVPDCFRGDLGSDKMNISGLPDWAKSYKLVWWVTVPQPPVFTESELHFLDPS